MLNPMLSPTTVTSPVCPGCVMTSLLCRAYSINHQELVFHQDHFPLQGPVQVSIQKMWMTPKTQVLHSSIVQPTAAKAVAKLHRKMILMPEKAAILDIRSCKMTPRSFKWENIWGLFKNVYFVTQNGGHLENWRPS